MGDDGLGTEGRVGGCFLNAVFKRETHVAGARTFGLAGAGAGHISTRYSDNGRVAELEAMALYDSDRLLILPILVLHCLCQDVEFSSCACTF